MRGCLKDAIILHDILKGISINSRDSIIRRFVKLGKWNAKKKEILQLCASLEKRKALMTMSGVYRILNYHELERRTVQPLSVVLPLFNLDDFHLRQASLMIVDEAAERPLVISQRSWAFYYLSREVTSIHWP